MITTIKYSSVVYSKEENIKYMKNYDNYFLPVDNMEEAKRYYEVILGLKRNLISLIREWLLIIFIYCGLFVDIDHIRSLK